MAREQVGLADGPQQPGIKLALPIDIAATPLVYRPRSATKPSGLPMSQLRLVNAPWVCRNIPARRLDGALPGARAASN